MSPQTVIMPIRVWRSRRPQSGFYDLFAKYLLLKSLEVSCAGLVTSQAPLRLLRSCRVTSSTTVGFWLYTFIVNVNHAESEENVSSCTFYFWAALDSSIPFSTAVYIVGLGWLSIVITLEAVWYRVWFPAGENVFLFFQMYRLLRLRMGRAVPCLQGVDSGNFTFNFCVLLLYMLLIMWNIFCTNLWIFYDTCITKVCKWNLNCL